MADAQLYALVYIVGIPLPYGQWDEIDKGPPESDAVAPPDLLYADNY
jgi:hypothetical protein